MNGDNGNGRMNHQPPPLNHERYHYPQTHSSNSVVSPPFIQGQGSLSANPSPRLPHVSSSLFPHISPRGLDEHGPTKSFSPSFFESQRYAQQSNLMSPPSDPSSTMISPGNMLPHLPPMRVSPCNSLLSPQNPSGSSQAMQLTLRSPSSPRDDTSVSLNSLIRRNTPTPTMVTFEGMLEPLNCGYPPRSPPAGTHTQLPPLRSVVGDYLPSPSPSSSSSHFHSLHPPPSFRSPQEDTMMQDAQMLSMMQFQGNQQRSPSLPKRTKLSDPSAFVSFSDPGFSQPMNFSQQSFSKAPVMFPNSKTTSSFKPSFPSSSSASSHNSHSSQQQPFRQDPPLFSNNIHPSGTGSLIAPRTQPLTPSAPRSCTVCGVTSTPRWRKGPKGRQSLCNSCGLKFIRKKKKEIKMAEFTQSAPPGDSSNTEMTDV